MEDLRVLPGKRVLQLHSSISPMLLSGQKNYVAGDAEMGVLAVIVLGLLVSGCATISAGTGQLYPEERLMYGEQYEQFVANYESWFTGPGHGLVTQRMAAYVQGVPVSNERLTSDRDAPMIAIPLNVLAGVLGANVTVDHLIDSLRLRGLAYSLTEVGRFDDAEHYCDMGIREAQQLLDIALRSDRPPPLSWVQDQALALGSIKAYLTWFRTGDSRDTLRTFSEANSIARVGGAEPLSVATVEFHRDLGLFQEKMVGDYGAASREYGQALETAQKLGVLATDAKYGQILHAHRRLMTLNMKLGRLESAKRQLDLYTEATQGSVLRLGALLVGATPLAQDYYVAMSASAGALFALAQDFNGAKPLFDKAAKVVENGTLPRAVGTEKVMYGAYYLGLQGRYDEAVQWVDSGLTYLRPRYISDVRSDMDIETASALSGELHFILGDLTKAWQRGEAAERYAGRYRNSLVQARALTLKGEIRFAQGQYREARREYEAALSLIGGVENTENWKLYYGLGRAYEKLRDPQMALSFYRRAVNEVEKLWSGRFKETVRQVSFIDNRLVVYEPLIRLAAQRKDAAEALEYTERSKARTFFDTRNALLADEGLADKAASFTPLSAREIQRILPDGVALLDYYAGEEAVLATLVARDRLEVKRLQVSSHDLRRQVAELRTDIEHRGNRYMDIGERLYSVLLAPFASHLEHYTRIGIVPHGVLHYLPFNALVVHGSLTARGSARGRLQDGLRPVFAVEKYIFFYEPSASVLSVTSGKPAAGTVGLLGVGSPPEREINIVELGKPKVYRKLESANEEVPAVAALFPVHEVFLDRGATETAVKREAPRYQVLLFSTHGELLSRYPQSSFLLFADDRKNDGRLTVAEVEQLPLYADLVALSACKTALVAGYTGKRIVELDARFPLGDDLVGLQRAFIRAGAASVLSSLWKASDSAALAVMTTFFQGRVEDKMDKANALRQAQLSLLVGGGLSAHPFYWAPFQLSGAWQ